VALCWGMPDYRKVRAGPPAEQLSVDVHLLARQLPCRDFPGVAPQLCRAAASVPANIVEGASRDTQADFAKFLVIARASAGELAVHLRLVASLDSRFRSKALDLEERANHVAAMLASLIAHIREAEARRENRQRSTRGRRSAKPKRPQNNDIGYPLSDNG
jgi:four helix bundle protein